MTLLIQGINASAQTVIKGKAIAENKEGISNASIKIVSGKNNKTTTANLNGEFLLENVSAANYQLQITAVGFETYEVLVKVKDKEVIDLGNLVLFYKSNQLQTVEVIGRTTKSYNSEYSFGATKTAMAVKDIPQSISTVTKELISDRQAFQLADAVKIASALCHRVFIINMLYEALVRMKKGKLLMAYVPVSIIFYNPLPLILKEWKLLKDQPAPLLAALTLGAALT